MTQNSMLEKATIEKIGMIPNFITKELTGEEHARCVDGRPDPNSEQGPQMLGGSLHPIVLSAIYSNADLTETFVANSVRKIQEEGHETGAHRGSHGKDTASDCGFSDRLIDIIQTAVENKDLITERIEQVLSSNKEHLEGLNLPPAQDLFRSAFAQIQNYQLYKIKVTGEKLVSVIENSNSVVETVEGDHKEECAYVNLMPRVTLDTLELNNQGRQALNLDLMAAVGQAEALGVPENFAIAASLILYSATEIVLVENKGKTPLSIEIHI